MVRARTDSEYLIAQKTAEEYRNSGYQVQLEAPLDFFPNFRADLLVRKGDEAKIIEVKSRPSLFADPRIAELARLIDAKVGWSFELVLVGEPEKMDSPAGARPLEPEGITQRVEQAEKSIRVGIPEAAFLLAWSACEIAVRDAIATEGLADSRITSPRVLLDQTVFKGVISRREYDNLLGMLKYRNAIIHGFDLGDFSAELVPALRKMVRRIITYTPEVGDVSEE